MRRNNSWYHFTTFLILISFIEIEGENEFERIIYINDGNIFTIDSNQEKMTRIDGKREDFSEYDDYMRWTLCCDALSYVFKGVKIDRKEFYPVPEARFFKDTIIERDSLVFTTDIARIKAISCPFSVPLYVYRRYDFHYPAIAKFRFKFRLHAFDIEYVKSAVEARITDSSTKIELRKHTLYNLEFGDRWELCFEASKLAGDKVTIEFSNVANPDIYRFGYIHGIEEYIAIACPTKPTLYIRFEADNTIMIIHVYK